MSSMISYSAREGRPCDLAHVGQADGEQRAHPLRSPPSPRTSNTSTPLPTPSRCDHNSARPMAMAKTPSGDGAARARDPCPDRAFAGYLRIEVLPVMMSTDSHRGAATLLPARDDAVLEPDRRRTGAAERGERAQRQPSAWRTSARRAIVVGKVDVAVALARRERTFWYESGERIMRPHELRS